MTLLRWIGFSFAAIILLIALLFWSLPTTLPLGLRLAGIDDVQFGLIDVGLQDARIEDLEIGNPPQQSVAVIEADYSLFSLLQGRLDRLQIDGLIAEAVYRDGRFSERDESGGGKDAGKADDPSGLTLPLTIETFSIGNSRIDVDTDFGLLSLPLSGELKTNDGRADFSLDIHEARLEAGHVGKLGASLNLTGHLPLAGAPDINQLVASGQLDLEGDGVASAAEAGPLAIGSTIDFEFAEGRLTVGGPLAITSGDISADGKLRAALAFDQQGTPVAIEDGEVMLDIAGLERADLSLDRGHTALHVDGPLDRLAGTLTFDIEGLTASLGEVEIRGFRGQRVLDLSLRDDKVEVSARGAEKKLSIDGVTLSDGGEEVLASGWFTVQWPVREGPWLRYDLKRGDAEANLALVVDPVRLEVGSNQLWARIEDLSAILEGSGDGLRAGTVRIRQGRVDMPSANLALTGIGSDLVIDDQGLAPGHPVPLTIRALRPLGEPRQFAPLRLDARITPGSDGLDFDGTLNIRANPSAGLSFSGEYDMDKGRGEIDFDLAPLLFRSGELQPHDLSPMLDGVLSDAVGEIALDGGITWRDGNLESDLALLIKEFGFAIGPAKLSRINSVIQIDGVSPPTTPAGQLLSVGLMDVGLPLTDGLVSMQLRRDGQLAIDQLTWRLAGGEIRAAPFTFGSDVKDLTMRLTAKQLDLNALLRLTPLDELTGEGRIDGTLPLKIGETAAIEGGELAASGPGVIKYAPSSSSDFLQAGGESVNLMLQALENFQYDALRLTLDGETDGDTSLGLHLKGANPELYDGYPVEFNLNLDGNLASLIQTNLDNYQIPDRIRERLQGFQR